MIKNAILYTDNDDFQFWKVREIGFSNKDVALDFNLYADFGMFMTSTYSSIFKHSLYSTNETLQFWIVDKKSQQPIGLSIAIRFHLEEHYNIEDKMGLNPGIILGQLHFFLKEEYQGLGLNKKIVPEMEMFLLEKSLLSVHPCIIMENKAYSLAKYTKEACILSHSCHKEKIENEYNLFIGKGIRFQPYNESYDESSFFLQKKKFSKKQINVF